LPSGDQWSDGLTVWYCGGGGQVHDNYFENNTDVDLIFGGGGTCSVTGNHISHTSRYGFAGLMIGWFGGVADHSGFYYANNTVTAALNTLGFGIMFGHHPWNLNVTIAGGATITNNTVTGAVVGVAVDGVQQGSIMGNSATGAQGQRGYHCTIAADFTAGDFGSTSVPGGVTSRTYHLGTCQ
jgi:hypothetical protein